MKKLIILILVASLLFLLIPSAVLSNGGGPELVGWIALGIYLLIIGGIIWIISANSFAPTDAGDIFVSFTGPSWMPFPNGDPTSSPRYFEKTDLNLNTLLTAKSNENLWVSAGLTFRMSSSGELSLNEDSLPGGNLSLGYSQDDLNYELNLVLLPEQQSYGTLRVMYRF